MFSELINKSPEIVYMFVKCIIHKTVVKHALPVLCVNLVK